MTDRLFRSMTRDRDSRKRLVSDVYFVQNGRVVSTIKDVAVDLTEEDGVRCPRCGTLYYAGDWPFCKGSAADHRRD